MKKVYAVMYDIETVDRIFLSKERAETYVEKLLGEMAYYQEHPERIKFAIKDYINELPLDEEQ